MYVYIHHSLVAVSQIRMVAPRIYVHYLDLSKDRHIRSVGQIEQVLKEVKKQLLLQYFCK
jgi:hypothetical protein